MSSQPSSKKETTTAGSPGASQRAGKALWILLAIPALILVLCLVAIVVIAILTLLGPQIANTFSKITNGLSAP